jgi:hypothetical protein
MNKGSWGSKLARDKGAQRDLIKPPLFIIIIIIIIIILLLNLGHTFDTNPNLLTFFIFIFFHLFIQMKDENKISSI